MTASLFTFDWDAEATDSIASKELAATLARIEIGANGRFATIAEDLQNGSIRRSVNVPLYPLAEWIVFNWWELAFGARSDRTLNGSRQTGGTERRARVHNLRSAGDGFCWPDMLIAPEGGMVRLEWHADREVLAGRGIRFVTDGVEWVTPEWVRDSFTSVVESVLVRLDEGGVGETPLHKEWAALRELDPDEVEFCQACGRLGLDPFSEGIDLARQIEGVFSSLDPSIVWDFYDAANPLQLEHNASWVEDADRAGRALLQGTGRSAALSDLQAAAAGGDWSQLSRPWEVGYAQARALRESLGLGPTQPVSTDLLPIAVDHLESGEPSLQGLVRTGEDRAALVMGWSASEAARRFAAARALWHAVSDVQGQVSLLTAGTSRGQQTARAFAAEFLAPAEGIRSVLGGAGATTVAPMVADRFRVAETVIEHQMENQLTRAGRDGWARL